MHVNCKGPFNKYVDKMREVGGQNFLMKMPPVLSNDRQNISVTKIKLRLAELKWVTTNGA